MSTRQHSFWGDVALLLGLKSLDRDIADMKWRQWKQVVYKTRVAVGGKNLGILAAGVAYYGTLSFFPMMVASVSISALFTRPDQLQATITILDQYLPKDIASLVSVQLTNLVDKPVLSLTAAIVAIVFSLWSMSGAAESLIRSLNVAYGVKETRNFFYIKYLSIALTVGVILGLLTLAPVIGVTESWLLSWGVPGDIVVMLGSLRWVVLVVISMVTLDVLYYCGPNRRPRKWQWVSWGSIVATGLWSTITLLFSIYTRDYANFSNSYSLFAGIIVLMIWLNISALAFLIGAAINYHLETK